MLPSIYSLLEHGIQMIHTLDIKILDHDAILLTYSVMQCTKTGMAGKGLSSSSSQVAQQFRRTNSGGQEAVAKLGRDPTAPQKTTTKN